MSIFPENKCSKALINGADRQPHISLGPHQHHLPFILIIKRVIETQRGKIRHQRWLILTASLVKAVFHHSQAVIMMSSIPDPQRATVTDPSERYESVEVSLSGSVYRRLHLGLSPGLPPRAALRIFSLSAHLSILAR